MPDREHEEKVGRPRWRLPFTRMFFAAKVKDEDARDEQACKESEERIE